MTVQEALIAAKEKLQTVSIVSTEENLDAMLGVIRLLGNCITFLSAPPAPPVPETEPKESDEKEPEPEEGNDHADPDPE